MEEKKNSSTFKVTTKGGFEVLVTFRDSDIVEAKATLALVDAVDAVLTEKGLKPQEKKSFGGFAKKEKEWTGDVCPKDGGRLYHMLTKTGKDLLKCENSKYDFTTKTSSGCDYTGWGKSLKAAAEEKAKWIEEQNKLKAAADEYGQA